MKKIALLSLVLAAGAAMAAEPASFDPQYTAGSFTRAQVQAEAVQAVKNDTLPQTGEVGQFAVESRSTGSRDRADVRAEARQATAAHLTFGEV
jgi:hypothetical protein